MTQPENKWPDGAIRTLQEAAQATRDALEGKAELYRARRELFYDTNSKWVIKKTWAEGQLCIEQYVLEDNPPFATNDFYLFTNYWLAHGYVSRLNAKKVRA